MEVISSGRLSKLLCWGRSRNPDICNGVHRNKLQHTVKMSMKEIATLARQIEQLCSEKGYDSVAKGFRVFEGEGDGRHLSVRHLPVSTQEYE